MTLEQLFALGATSTCGNIDLKGKNVGRLLASGEVLITPEGEEVLASHQVPPVAKPKRSKKAAEPVVEPAAPADEDADLGDLLSDME